MAALSGGVRRAHAAAIQRAAHPGLQLARALYPRQRQEWSAQANRGRLPRPDPWRGSVHWPRVAPALTAAAQVPALTATARALALPAAAQVPALMVAAQALALPAAAQVLARMAAAEALAALDAPIQPTGAALERQARSASGRDQRVWRDEASRKVDGAGTARSGVPRDAAKRYTPAPPAGTGIHPETPRPGAAPLPIRRDS
jgi:hypothetical protein